MTTSPKSKKQKISLVPITTTRKPISIPPAAISPIAYADTMPLSAQSVDTATMSREEIIASIPKHILDRYLEKRSQAPQPIAPVLISPFIQSVQPEHEQIPEFKTPVFTPIIESQPIARIKPQTIIQYAPSTQWTPEPKQAEEAQEEFHFNDFQFDEQLLLNETPSTLYQAKIDEVDVSVAQKQPEAEIKQFNIDDIPVQIPAQTLLHMTKTDQYPVISLSDEEIEAKSKENEKAKQPQNHSMFFTMDVNASDIIDQLENKAQEPESSSKEIVKDVAYALTMLPNQPILEVDHFRTILPQKEDRIEIEFPQEPQLILNQTQAAPAIAPEMDDDDLFDKFDQFEAEFDQHLNPELRASLPTILPIKTTNPIVEPVSIPQSAIPTAFSMPIQKDKSLNQAQTQAQTQVQKSSVIPLVNFQKQSIEVNKSESWDISFDQENLPDFTPSQRYKIGQEIAQGGVGKILMVYDKLLKRNLVMKTLKKSQSARHVKRLLEEALISAQLQHPNIAPIHDVGLLENGEYFFTMKHIQGRSLKSILREIKQTPTQIEKYPLFKLLGYFKQICQAIAFAHSQKIIHRDLKPSNVMIGDFGEVLVVDWGIAKRLGEISKEEQEELVLKNKDFQDEINESEDDSTHDFQVYGGSKEYQNKQELTRQGTITGTLSYMSPEQARGDSRLADERTDIYALGGILYEILCFRPPFRGKDSKKVIHHILHEALVPPSQLTQLPVPTFLEEMALKALSKEPKHRQQNVSEIISALDQYLSQSEAYDQRKRIALEKYQQSQHINEGYQKILKEKIQIESQLLELNYAIPVFAPIEKRKEIWQKKAELYQKEIQYYHAYSNLEQMLSEVLAVHPDFNEALDDLAELYRQRYEEAEYHGLEEQMIYFRDALLRLGREQHQDFIKRKGGLEMRTIPSKADVYASRYVEVDLIKRPIKEVHLGMTPIVQSQQQEGTWRLRIEAPGYRSIIHHVSIQRGQITDASVPFYTEEEIGKHFVYVPQGTFTFGGEVFTRDQITQQKQVQQAGFCISKYLVTVGEYLQFIRYLDEINPKEAQARVPRLRPMGGFLWKRNAQGKFELPSNQNAHLLAQVEDSSIEGLPGADEIAQMNLNWSLKWPIFGISFADAQRYCWWYRRVRGIDVRLPTEQEWEKAARGTDARLFPWGNDFDASFCHTAEGRNGIVSPVNIVSYPRDVSPYGVYDMAGLVQEFCDSAYGQNQQIKVLKGGSFEAYHPWQCRTHHKEGMYMYAVKLSVGFRLARSLPR